MRCVAFLVLAVLAGFVLTFAGSLGVAAPVPKHLMKEAENTEQAKLQGKWQGESVSVGDLLLAGPGKAAWGMTLEISDNKFTFTSGGTETATFKLDTIDGFKRCTLTDREWTAPDRESLVKGED